MGSVGFVGLIGFFAGSQRVIQVLLWGLSGVHGSCLEGLEGAIGSPSVRSSTPKSENRWPLLKSRESDSDP